MRLIDADKLPATCNVAIVNGKIELDGWIAAKRIEEAPTVKAIPIEWLYEWRIKNNEQYNVGLSSFSQMISDWEKENETN